MRAANRLILARRLRVALLFGGVSTCAVACATLTGAPPSPSPAPGVALGSLTVTSKSFPADLQIPVDFTCDGRDVSPQLTWSAPPEGTKSIVVMLDDRDAPSGGFTHWIVVGLPGDALSLAEGADAAQLGAKLGQNDFQSVRYNGPCPPAHQLHRYRYWVYAVDAPLPLPEGATRADVDRALGGHVLAAGALEATFAH